MVVKASICFRVITNRGKIIALCDQTEFSNRNRIGSTTLKNSREA